MNLIQRRLIAEEFVEKTVKKDFAFLLVKELEFLSDVIIKFNHKKLFRLDNDERIKLLDEAGFIKGDKVIIPAGAKWVDSENYTLYSERTFIYNGNVIEIIDRTDDEEFIKTYIDE